MRDKRVSVRVGESLAKKLRELACYSKSDFSTLVRQALEALYAKTFSKTSNPWEAWSSTGFIGCGEGPNDLSQNCKEYQKCDFDKTHPR